MKTSFCKAKPYILACVACTLPVSSVRHILSRGNHVPSDLRVGEQSESRVRRMLRSSCNPLAAFIGYTSNIRSKPAPVCVYSKSLTLLAVWPIVNDALFRRLGSQGKYTKV